MLTPDEVVYLIGYAIGGVCFFSIKELENVNILRGREFVNILVLRGRLKRKQSNLLRLKEQIMDAILYKEYVETEEDVKNILKG